MLAVAAHPLRSAWRGQSRGPKPATHHSPDHLPLRHASKVAAIKRSEPRMVGRGFEQIPQSTARGRGNLFPAAISNSACQQTRFVSIRGAFWSSFWNRGQALARATHPSSDRGKGCGQFRRAARPFQARLMGRGPHRCLFPSARTKACAAANSSRDKNRATSGWPQMAASRRRAGQLVLCRPAHPPLAAPETASRRRYTSRGRCPAGFLGFQRLAGAAPVPRASV